MEQIRAFIAIELSEELRASLAGLQELIKPGSESCVKWVDPQGIHLTLKFLGNIPVGKVSEITKAIAEVARSAAPFRLQLTEFGAFPNLRAPRVAWVGLGGDVESLLRLQRGIDQAIVPLGFAAEGRAFSPHLTLGRVREQAAPQEQRKLGERIGALKVQGQPSLYVDKVSLMRSQLTTKGAIYSRLSAAELLLPTGLA
jgi:2'-5' RNA ligase